MTIVIILIMAYMSISGGRFSSPGDWFLSVLLTLPGIIIGLSFHEFAHAFTAYKLGDPTPKFQRRVTVNPIAHMDPVGLLCIIFIGFGWGKPVVVNPRNFRARKRDDILVSLAGVTMNLLIAVIFSALYAALVKSAGLFMMTTDIGWIIISIVRYTVRINLVLMVFNLLPVPPLDGFNVITEILNIKYTDLYYKIYQNGMLILMLLIIFRVVDFVLRYTVNPLYVFLIGLFL